MKLIIDIPEMYYEFCIECLINRTDTVDQQFIANGIPYEERPQGEWIPVSERLPKAFEFVNCTCHSLIDDREDWVIETVYVPQPSDSPYSDWGNIPMLNSGDCKVVAWVHRDIPQPYRESEVNANDT